MKPPIDSSSAVDGVGEQRLRGHPQLRRPGEERRGDKRLPPRGESEKRRFGNGHQPAAAAARTRCVAAAWTRAVDSRPSSRTRSVADQLLREQRIGPAVDDVAVDAVGRDDAAGPRRRSSDERPEPARLQLPRRGEPRDAGADHDHISHLARPALRRREAARRARGMRRALGARRTPRSLTTREGRFPPVAGN